MPTVAEIASFLDRLAPPALAADWDNVGLLLGDPASNVERLMTCLTVTPTVVAEAVAEHVQLIVTHHPILFRAVKRLTAATPDGQVLLPLLAAGIAVHSPHTAWDNARGGINDLLAGRLNLTDVKPLRPARDLRQCKIVVFVPETDLERVADAMFAAGAGNIGEYAQCSFRLGGMGTFFGSNASNPTLGQKGRREHVNEFRLETICPDGATDRVVAAMRRAHSYEEPAFDVYPLRPGESGPGLGRIGRLAQPTTLGDLAQATKHALKAGLVQIVGDDKRSVQTVALACGAAGDFLSDAAAARADVFLTGEMRFHEYLAAQRQHVALLLPGHYATERPGIEVLADNIRKSWPDLCVWASKQERDPVNWLATTH
ncbi:MAG: Nif3-like dinuclear metal center hexameric protein [Planctomycetes bacterium]|nr:Nif3-like dinuclear metal center hexameric protein [Planctomycetota bacterium]